MSPSLRFGEDLELDRGTYQLRRAGRPLKLERIPMEILLLLTEHRGHVVSREQIAERIWGKNVYLDIDNSINGAMRKIRQVLRDDPEQPRFIQTVTGRGYRFIAPVVDAQEPVTDAAASAELPAVPSQPRARTKPWLVPAVTLSLLAVALTLAVVWSRARSIPEGGKVMVAVLPFQNLTGDPRQEYFSEGLTEEMITQLGNRDPEHLGVIGRTSVMHYRNSPEPLDQIERELGVQYVLAGSVRRDVNHVRVTAQLIQAKDQSQIWARQYDRELQGLLTLQGEIAQEIADEIESSLGGQALAAGGQPPRSANEFAAYDLYLKGQYVFNKRGAADLEAAIRYFREATARDSSYARAYAALADAYALLIGYSQSPPGDLITKARAAALRALALDPSLPEAHAALALIVQNHDWDWQTAEREYRRAIELNPNYATAHHWYAEHLMWRGRFDDALRESERARQLDPLSLIIAADNGAILYYSRQYDRAIAKWRSVLDIDPDFPRADLIAFAYVEKGLLAAALADVERQRPRHTAAGYWGTLAYVYGRAGQAAQARHATQQFLQATRRYPVQAGAIAAVFAAQGDKDQAMVWLEKAYAERSNEITNLKVNPAYDVLRDDPRFQQLLERVGLAK